MPGVRRPNITHELDIAVGVLDVRCALFVTGAVSVSDLHEAVPFVKPLGSFIGRKGPQPQSARALALCHIDEETADPATGIGWVHIELVGPIAVEDEDAQQLTVLRFGDLQLELADNVRAKPRSNVLSCMRWRGNPHRRQPRVLAARDLLPGPRQPAHRAEPSRSLANGRTSGDPCVTRRCSAGTSSHRDRPPRRLATTRGGPAERAVQFPGDDRTPEPPELSESRV